MAQLRPAGADDVAAIAALHAASWRRTYAAALSPAYLAGDIVAERQALWATRLSTPAHGMYTVLAERQSELLGFACAVAAGARPTGLDGPSLLDNLHVAPGLQGQGLGRRLLLDAAAWCHAAAPGCGMALSVLQSNHRARRFYAHLGAVHVGDEAWMPPGGGSVPCHVLAWHGAAWAALVARAGAGA